MCVEFEDAIIIICVCTLFQWISRNGNVLVLLLLAIYCESDEIWVCNDGILLNWEFLFFFFGENRSLGLCLHVSVGLENLFRPNSSLCEILDGQI